LAFVARTLSAMGYAREGDHTSMKHDYLRLLLADLWTAKNVPFLSAGDLREEEEWAKFIGHKKPATPDFVLVFRNQWLLLDAVSAVEDRKEDESKRKYKAMGPMYTARVLPTRFLRYHFGWAVPELLTEEELTYVEDHLAAFETEQEYWRLGVQKWQSRFVCEPHLVIQPWSFPADAATKKAQLKELMLNKFGQFKKGFSVTEEEELETP
jgi:hypothetical protein